MTVPSWVQDAVFYQIFPDRFANGDPSNDPPNVQNWGTPPTRRGFQGGDLKGITTNLDHLLDLGFNAIYLNPIFMAASTHRYDTIDYLRIDPKLGDLHDFHELVSAAHHHGIRIILDGVFNHCARGFFAFNDILENEVDSPYLNWFHINKFPLRAYDKGKARQYEAWWGFKSLPKLNTDYPPVRKYLLNVARYWIEQGADGWRLDVPNEIDDDGFWAEFRQTVLAANPDAYILGEIWETIPRWVDDQHFDGLMNYPVRTAVLDLLSGRQTPTQFDKSLDAVFSAYPQENCLAMYNLLGSHDTERVLTVLKNDVQKLKLSYLCQFAFPGAPAIYYGDEIGLQGSADPDCRRAFSWDKTTWNKDIYDWVKKLIVLRKSSPILRQGGYQSLVSNDKASCFAFARITGQHSIIVAINASDSAAVLDIPVENLGFQDGHRMNSLTGDEGIIVENGFARVPLQPWQGIYLS